MERNKRDFKYYRSNNRFFGLLKDSKKYKNLWSPKEGLASLIITVFLTMLVWFVLKSYDLSNSVEVDKIFTNIRSIILTFIGGFLSVLGFTIGGLALITGTISENVLRNIEKDDKEESLVNVIFIFYFSGFLNGLNVLILSSVYLVSLFNLPVSPWLFITITAPVIYLLFFSLIYSIMLLGTCIRIFLLRDYHKENI